MSPTAIVPASGDPPPPEAIERAAAALLEGGVVVMPTDTVYGLAVAARSPGATNRLFALKGRPPEVALPVLVAGIDQASELADELPLPARRVMRRWWPGGITVVVRRRPGLGLELGGADAGTIGLRVPDHPVPRALAARVGPLAVTSANRHRQPTPTTVAAVVDQLGTDLDVVLDGGPCVGAPSTVVVCVGAEFQLLREGTVPFADIVAVASGAGHGPGDDAAGPGPTDRRGEGPEAPR